MILEEAGYVGNDDYFSYVPKAQVSEFCSDVVGAFRVRKETESRS